MKTTKPLPAVAVIITAIVLCFSAGCKTTLAPDGAYNGDLILYRVDETIKFAYTTFDTFLRWEEANASTLSARPEIKKVADYIRVNAKLKDPEDPNAKPGWFDLVREARNTYLIFPTQENATALANSLAPIQSAISDITKIQTSAK